MASLVNSMKHLKNKYNSYKLFQRTEHLPTCFFEARITLKPKSDITRGENYTSLVNMDIQIFNKI